MYVTLDFSFCTKLPAILCILSVTALIGFLNDTDIYYKLNQLPDDRNELTPFQRVVLHQIDGTNRFYFEIDVKCALQETYDNILRSLKFRVKGDFFFQVGDVKINSTQFEFQQPIKGSFTIDFEGHFAVALLYMYEPLYEKEYDVKSTGHNYYNSVLKIYNDNYSHHKYERVCQYDGVLHTFAQDTVINRQNYQSVGATEFLYHSEISFNINDYRSRFNETTNVESGSLFIADVRYTRDWFRNIILPFKEWTKLNNNSSIYLIIKNSQNDDKMMFDEDLRLHIYAKPTHLCFEEVDLYHLDPVLKISPYLSVFEPETKNETGFVVLGKKEDFHKDTVKAIQDVCGSPNVIFTETSNLTDQIPIQERIGLIYGAKCVLTKSDNHELSALARGTVFYLSHSEDAPKKPLIELNPQTKYIHYNTNDYQKRVNKEIVEKAFNNSISHMRQYVDENTNTFVDI